MGNCYGMTNKDIISEKSLNAVQNVVEYLKEDVIQRDIFRATGQVGISQQIARELGRGGKALYRLLEDASVKDVANGLIIFFMFLKKPLVPVHIQAIVLDPDNRTVCPEVVAQDALGLIKQEVYGRRFKLIQLILDLLHHVLKYTPTDELSGTNVPIYMMPIFFNMQADHIAHWKRVATIFVEMIRLAPQYLNIEEASPNTNHLIVQAISQDYNRVQSNFLQQRLDEMNFVLRRYFTRTGNRGDALCFEIYLPRHNRRRNPQDHINRVF